MTTDLDFPQLKPYEKFETSSSPIRRESSEDSRRDMILSALISFLQPLLSQKAFIETLSGLPLMRSDSARATWFTQHATADTGYMTAHPWSGYGTLQTDERLLIAGTFAETIEVLEEHVRETACYEPEVGALDRSVARREYLQNLTYRRTKGLPLTRWESA